MLGRRDFLGVMLGAGMGLAAFPRGGAAAAGKAFYISAKADASGRHFLAGFDDQGHILFDIALPERGHGIAISPDFKTAIAPARRPGTFACVVDLTDFTAKTWLQAPPGRHFHGHGAFSGDGRLLFTSENDYAAGRGVIGVWETRGWSRTGEFSSHGIEPHDIRIASDGTTLIVANGGIQTHPERGRAKLNLETMRSSVVRIDTRSGALLQEWALGPELRLLSLRHLAVSAQDEVAVAMQHQGPQDEIVPLVALLRANGAIDLLTMPQPFDAQARNYAGSAAMDLGGRLVGASCPRGNFVGFWDVATGHWLGRQPMLDGCGIAPGSRPGSMVLTSGMGGAGLWSRESYVPLGNDFPNGGRWDNHLAAVL